MKGKKVLLVDADEQQSARDWGNQRKSSPLYNPSDLSVFTASSQTLLEMKRDSYDDIFVDVGGRDTRNQRAALIISDVFLIPFRPRSFDIWTIASLIEMINDVRKVNPNLKCYACLNQADAKGKDNEDAKKIILENPEFIFLDTFIVQRKCFSNATADGLSVLELKVGNKTASEEIYNLYQKIYE